MRLHRLQRVQILSVSLEEAWQFFSSPFNLPSITPPWLNLKVSNRVSNKMFPGMVIAYRVTPFLGIPVGWVSEITHVDPLRYFVDEQRFGPYRFWHHQHHFQTVEEGIEMIDTVHYALKFGLFGNLMHTFLIRKKLEEIFDFRRAMLGKLFS